MAEKWKIDSNAATSIDPVLDDSSIFNAIIDDRNTQGLDVLVNNAYCWTKVYGVLIIEFLWLFKSNHSSRTMLLQIAVSSVEVSGQRQLRPIDPNGADMGIWFMNEDTFVACSLRSEQATALTTQFFRMTETEARHLPRNSSLVSYRRNLAPYSRFVVFVRVASRWRTRFVKPVR